MTKRKRACINTVEDGINDRNKLRRTTAPSIDIAEPNIQAEFEVLTTTTREIVYYVVERCEYSGCEFSHSCITTEIGEKYATLDEAEKVAQKMFMERVEKWRDIGFNAAKKIKTIERFVTHNTMPYEFV